LKSSIGKTPLVYSGGVFALVSNFCARFKRPTSNLFDEAFVVALVFVALIE
jgi:hypothetical protein